MTDNNASAEGDREPFSSGFRLLDHTADIGVHARGRSLEGAFASAGMGLFSVITTDLGIVELKLERELAVTGTSLEELLLAFLDELLFLFETEQLLFSWFSVELEKGGEDWRLKAVAEGEKFDPDRHPYPVEVKAITRHMLEVGTEPPFDIKVLFDL